MKNIYYVGICLTWIIGIAETRADYLSSSASHLVDIKTQPNTIGTKPTSSSIKYASVSFITDRKKYVDFNCNPGWTIKSHGCEPNDCKGFPYANQEEIKNCKTVDTCQSGDVMKYRCTSCADNLIPNGSGGCMCDTNKFPYNVVNNPCVSGVYNASGPICSEFDAKGIASTYYSDCKCPADGGWKLCNTAKITGDENSAICYSENIKYYSKCRCSNEYKETCAKSEPTDYNDYCINPETSVKYYKECYFCNIGEGEIYSLDDFWCDSKWVTLDNIVTTVQDALQHKGE